MNRKRLYSIAIISALLISLAGAMFGAYIAAFEDPFSDNEKEIREVETREGETETVITEGEEKLPAWFVPLIGASALAALAFAGLSGMVYVKTKRGENMVRLDLLDLITVNPGINLTSIRKELELSQGAVSYHIMKLEKNGKIFSDKGSKERRYYPSSMGYSNAMEMAHRDEVASILSNKTSSSIVDLLREGPRSQNELVKELGISPSTVHWHMERMKKVDMIRKEQRGRSVYYDLLELPEINT